MPLKPRSSSELQAIRSGRADRRGGLYAQQRAQRPHVGATIQGGHGRECHRRLKRQFMKQCIRIQSSYFTYERFPGCVN